MTTQPSERKVKWIAEQEGIPRARIYESGTLIGIAWRASEAQRGDARFVALVIRSDGKFVEVDATSLSVAIAL